MFEPRAGSLEQDRDSCLNNLSQVVVAVERALAAGRRLRAVSDADAAVKAYDLVAGAAVDAAWREDPLVNRRVARPKLHCRAAQGGRKQSEAGRDGFLLPPCSEQGLGELWWSGIPPWRIAGIARVRRARPVMEMGADKAVPVRGGSELSTSSTPPSGARHPDGGVDEVESL